VTGTQRTAVRREVRTAAAVSPRANRTTTPRLSPHANRSTEALVEALAVLDRRAADDVTARVGDWRDQYDEVRIEAENAQCALPDER
jgi:hypothetical protein